MLFCERTRTSVSAKLRLPPLGQLLHNLLEHLGRIVLTTLRTRLTTSTACDLPHFDGR